MRFGKCKECNKYKYLKDKVKCLSCLKSEESWVVLMARGFTAKLRIYKEDLTKEEANRIASKGSLYIAKPESEVDK